jgi:hypothetical protein
VLSRAPTRLLAVAVVLAVGGAGCAKGEDAVVIADPVAEALAHAPADAAALAVVATDAAEGPGAALVALAQRFPGVELVRAQLQAVVGDRLGLDVEEELRPLLGHPLALWSDDGDPARRSAAWVVRDGTHLGELLEARARRGALTASGAEGEYAVFARRGGGAYGRRGPVLVTAPDEAALRGVLRRRAAGRGQWSAPLLRERGLGLPEGRSRASRWTPARWSSGGAGRCAAYRGWPGSSARRSRSRRWAAACASTPAPAPRRSRRPTCRWPAGVEPPATRGRAPLVAAVRGPGQTLAFARRVTELLDPGRLDALDRTAEVLRRYARVDLQEDLVDRLTGSATLTSPDGRRLTLAPSSTIPRRPRTRSGGSGRSPGSGARWPSWPASTSVASTSRSATAATR